MIENINNLENNRSINSDICIIGAGAAGITLALELNKSNKKIILLEAGGFDFPGKEGLDLYSGESIGRDYDIQNSRLRYFGGTTNHWGGWCRPLDKIDFEEKPHADHNGWPITRDDLREYYRKAAKICEIDNFEEFEQLNTNESNNVLKFKKNSILTNKYFVFSPPTRFGTRYRKDISDSTNITCLHNANASDLIIKDGVVKGVKVQTLKNRNHKVNATKVIVAMGGIENARFLLLNCANNKAHGIPNANQLIGKYFMDHPGMSPGQFLLQNNLKYYQHKGTKGVVMPLISLTDKAIHNNNLMNIALLLRPIKENNLLKNHYLDNNFLQLKQGGSSYSYQAIIEPTPYNKSAVYLSNEKDKLNQRKLKLDWRINPNDYKQAERAFQLIAKELALQGLGRAKFKEDFIETSKKSMGYGMHHMGTTKMGNSTRTSVVNSYGELHEIKNLFIAGSSLFPSVGFSNPTLTITALCIRLAEYFKNE